MKPAAEMGCFSNLEIDKWLMDEFMVIEPESVLVHASLFILWGSSHTHKDRHGRNRYFRIRFYFSTFYFNFQDCCKLMQEMDRIPAAFPDWRVDFPPTNQWTRDWDGFGIPNPSEIAEIRFPLVIC